jgi:hypothetical protein
MDGELRRREICKKFIALRLGDEQNDTPGQRNKAIGRGLSSGCLDRQCPSDLPG